MLSMKKLIFLLLFLTLTACENYRVKGGITFDGTSIDKLTTVQPRFWCRDEEKNKEVSAQVQYRNGYFLIKEIPPGNYGLSIDIDANPDNPPMFPGDFRAWTRFNVTEGKRTELDVDVSKVLHLLSPQDNGSLLPHWSAECEEKPSFPGPVVLTWEPMGDDVRYDYAISRMGCAPYRTLDTAGGATTTNTTMTLRLPPSAPNEFYQLTLAARKNGKTVGTLMTHGSNGYGWDYRFRVR